jgi:Fe-S cluster assembly protein SufD
MSTPLARRIAEEYASAARTLPAAGAARRRAAIEALQASGLPSAREENWRYANLRPLERQRFSPAAAPKPPSAGELPVPIAGYARYVFVDGVFAPALSAALDATAAQLTRLAVDAAAGSAAAAEPPFAWEGERIPQSDERFALLNQAFATDGMAIRVPASSVSSASASSAGATSGSDAPVRLELLFMASADSQSGASYPRIALRLEPGARLELIERHVSAGAGASFVTSAVTVELARGARLQHYRLQDLNSRGIFFDTLSANVAQGASYRLHGIHIGGQSARSTLGVRLAGERAALSLGIAALGESHQIQDTYVVVEHAAAHGRTEQTFRGIAAGRARVACNSKIVVAQQAKGTDSRQSLRGLLAGPEAEIDVRPQLEIYTDEVNCSHGATAGKLDENVLFYLLSRGLPRATAERLLKWAFLGDVVAQIALPELRRQIEARLAGQLRDEHLRELL